MRPFFFGSAKRQLYGAYHPASDDAETRTSAVVLAYPWMAEYNMSHWAFRKLAGMLAREGFPTLRFDYYGTGDSMGHAREAGPADWIADLTTAGREVLELSGLSQVSLVGKGLGALLALHASSTLPVRELVMWEPVISGANYLKQLDRIDDSQRLYRLYPPAPAPGTRDELLGFELPRATRAAIGALHGDVKPHLDGALVMVVGSQQAEHGAWLNSLKAHGAKARIELAEEEGASAVVAAEGQTALLSSKPLTVITNTMIAGESS